MGYEYVIASCERNYCKGDKRVKKKIISIAILLTVILLSSCTEADKVSENVSMEADNFNVMRRLAVINTVDGSPVFEMIGRFSIKADTDDNQLEVVVEVEDGVYKKHIVGLNQATTMYVVEDINGTKVDKFAYEINYLPKSIVPYKFVHKE
jgi:outer membrane lipoprotein-sorting protein